MIIEIGDIVRHKTTGITGKVIAYGYRKVSDSYYLTTLKVELGAYSPIAPIAEDLFNRWQMQNRRERILACTLPHFPKPQHTLCKIG